MQLWLIAFGYAAVLSLAAVFLYVDHLRQLNNPVEASGGMYAFGQALLGLFIACLFMIPTVFLLWILARVDAFSNSYSQLLVGISLSAPVCLGLFYFCRNQVAQSLSILCFFRLLASPFILVGLGVSRFAARSDPAKKRISYALLIEAVTLGIAAALVVHG